MRADPPGRPVFADRALAQRLERAEAESNARFVEAWGRVYPGSGARWIEVAGAYAMFDGVDSPTTQTFGLGMFAAPTDRALEALERFYAERGAAVNHEVSPLAGVEVATALVARGYHPIEFTSVMFRPLDRPGRVLQSDIRVREAGPDEGTLWAELSARGWSEHPELGDYLRALGPVMAERVGTVAVFAELDRVPVAAGALCLHGGVAVFAGASTVPEARRRGAQLALLTYRLALARDRGADVAMMCAVPGSASQRNAERHGFRIAYTRTKWHRALRPT